MRVALFARYSSKLQDEMSLEAQLHEMEGHVAKQEGWAVVRRFLLPETRSADLERSPEFQAMISAARRKEFDILLVHKLDRFGRDRETSVVHKAMLRRLGIQVTSVAENLGESIMDRAMEGMLEVMAEWYSHNLASETRKGQRALTRKGLWTGGKVPFGLFAEDVRDGDHLRKRLVSHPVEGPIMAKVFAMVAAGQSSGEVQDYLQAVTGSKWILPTLYGRLKNPLYYGCIEYGKTAMPQGRRRKKGEEVTESTWEGIVTKEVWQKANDVVAARGRKASGSSGAREPYLLSGLVSCLRCGGSIVGGREKGDRRYSCTNRRHGKCAHASISARRLEAMALGTFREWLAGVDMDRVMEEYKASLAPERDGAKTREAGLRKQLVDVRKKLANLLKALEEGIIFDDMQARIKALKVEESELADNIGRCQYEASQSVGLNVSLVREYLQRLKGDLTNPSLLQPVLRHALRLEVDLVEKTGNSYVGIPLQTTKPAETMSLRAAGEFPPRPYDGRSARTFIRTGSFQWLSGNTPGLVHKPATALPLR